MDVKRPAEAKSDVASLTYLQWQDLYETEKPLQVFANVVEGSIERLTNLVFKSGPPQEIHDIRGREAEFTLDENGFKMVYDPVKEPFRL